MAVVLLVCCWLTASLIVAKLLERYRNQRTTHAVILGTVFLCWLFPISITFLLPIDVSSTRYEQCLSGASIGGDCTQSWLYVPAPLRHASWLVVYWTTFILSWMFVPFLQGYVVAGEFDMLGKIFYSLRLNLFFYGITVLGLTVLVVYLRLGTTITTWEGIMAFLMALSNALGLLAVLLFLGHGLIRIPRRLWHSSDPNRQLHRLESRALAAKEAFQDAEEELAVVVRIIQALPYRARHHPELQSYVDELLVTAPIPSDDELLMPRAGGENNKPQNDFGFDYSNSSGGPVNSRMITLKSLEEVNYRIREAISARDRTAWEWRALLEEAWYWQDVQSNSAAGSAFGWQSSVSPPIRTPWQRKVAWWWHVHTRPLLLKVASVICLFLSFVVFWSEVTLPVTDADLSLIRPLIGLRSGTVEALTVALLLYLALCTYSSFLKLRVFHYFHLVPGQHTDDKSLLFFAAYITRLTFPLGYNYITLVDRALHTEFARVMGTMNLLPLLGRYFNLYVPLSLSVVCVAVALRLHHSVGDHQLTNTDMSDGKELIGQARRLEERESHARSRMYSSNLSSWRQSRNPSSSFQADGNPPGHFYGRHNLSGSAIDSRGNPVNPFSSKSPSLYSSTSSRTPSPRSSQSNVWAQS